MKTGCKIKEFNTFFDYIFLLYFQTDIEEKNVMVVDFKELNSDEGIHFWFFNELRNANFEKWRMSGQQCLKLTTVRVEVKWNLKDTRTCNPFHQYHLLTFDLNIACWPAWKHLFDVDWAFMTGPWYTTVTLTIHVYWYLRLHLWRYSVLCEKTMLSLGALLFHQHLLMVFFYVCYT